ncbi:MAG: 16S rRNA processing protein RimM [Acidobacteria bacterium]|nr:16S rRNA processing protein RimM [Acidobacteriota bacterium]
MADTNDSQYLTIARIRKVWGRRGEVAAEVLTDFPERFQPGTELLVAGHELRRTMALESVWFHKGLANLKFQGIDDISSAEPLVGCEIQIPASDRMALRTGQVYVSDLIGCDVLEEGNVLGTVEAVQETAGALLLQVMTRSGELLIPFAEEICTDIDLPARQIHVRLPDGLKELNKD